MNEKLEEVYIKDDLGIYVMYDCVLQDMKSFEENLIKIASFFMAKSEVLIDPQVEKPVPAKDRLELIQDLLTAEATFQFKKVKLV